eukprot:SAG11_NODE_13435_length_655_cov_1.104317_1_plen_30_part_10
MAESLSQRHFQALCRLAFCATLLRPAVPAA